LIDTLYHSHFLSICSHAQNQCQLKCTTNKDACKAVKECPKGCADKLAALEKENADLDSTLKHMLACASTDEIKAKMVVFPYSIPYFDTSRVVDMSRLFKNSSGFNHDLSRWDVSRVTSMKEMFSEASQFEGNISGWNVLSVTTMERMFYYSSNLNVNLNSWDLSSVQNMKEMFEYSNINMNVSNWNVSSVKNMHDMFAENKAFNGNVMNWDTSSVEDMNYMFYLTTNFNSNVSKWNVSSVTDMRGMFMSSKFNNQKLCWSLKEGVKNVNIFYDTRGNKLVDPNDAQCK